MKKTLYIVSDFLIVAFLAGAYIIQYFAKRKLGMSRWVMFQVSKWKEVLPIGVLRFVVPVILLGLSLLLFWIYWKRKAMLKKLVFPIVLFTEILALFYMGFTLLKSPETVRAYYLVLPLIGLAQVVQLVKAGVAVLVCKNEE